MTSLRRVVLAFSLLLAINVSAQILAVDTLHVRNSFAPNQTLGAGIDRVSTRTVDTMFTKPIIDRVLEAGWGPVTYRQNTELYTEAWHWNPKGSWSDPVGQGYFVGDATPGEPIRYSYGYPLPHRGVTRDDGVGTSGYSRLTDGDTSTYWKSNPYLTKAFTGEDDSKNPQWIFFDLGALQNVDAIRIAWAEPYARSFAVQFFTGDDPIHFPNKGVWQSFPFGVITDRKGGNPVVKLAASPIPVRWVRLWMTESSNTCDTHGSADRRNCVGYAIQELYMGTLGPYGEFSDVLRHTPDQDQTPTYCSSVDPWHDASDIDRSGRTQVGFDFFYSTGYTRGLPAMIPIALIYSTPEDAAAQIRYLEARHYPISYVEMGEEPDGHYMLPEDYAALYLQFADAIHKVDPSMKLGGPIFTGQNKDIEVWADDAGRTSWTGRFIDYLKSHKRLSDLAFFSFEHYPFPPCNYNWTNLYDEPTLVSHIVDVWHEDGVPATTPLYITESNVSSQSSESAVAIYGSLWLADYIGASLTSGISGIYYFHYIPEGVLPGCNHSSGNLGMFQADDKSGQITQPLGQFFASQLINLEWLKPGAEIHQLYAVDSDIKDGVGHTLVTAYAAKRPDQQWSLLIINKDQENPHSVSVEFQGENLEATQFAGPIDVVTFGAAQYHWDPLRKVADPDGPALKTSVNAGRDTKFKLPPAAIVVLRGKVQPVAQASAGKKPQRH